MMQRTFAHLLNGSSPTERPWEQEQRVPVGPTPRLLGPVEAAPGLATRWHIPVISEASNLQFGSDRDIENPGLEVRGCI
jgi:hypothetical protein